MRNGLHNLFRLSNYDQASDKAAGRVNTPEIFTYRLRLLNKLAEVFGQRIIEIRKQEIRLTDQKYGGYT
jgi:hypothetical protein